MPNMLSFLATFFHDARRLLNELSSHGQKWIMINWAMGSMIGLSVAASVSINSSEMPAGISIGAVVGCTAGTAKYASQNWAEVQRFGLPTALALLAIIVFQLHGADNWISVFRWSPIFLPLTLLASVNIAPRMSEKINTLGVGFSAILELAIRSTREAGQDRDPEQAAGLLQEMVEPPYIGPHEPEGMDFLLDHMDPTSGAGDLAWDEEHPDSIELRSGSVSTSPSVRRLLQPLNKMDAQESEGSLMSPIEAVPGQNIIFPPAPEGHPLERPSSRSFSGSRTEESSLAYRILG